MSASNDPQRRPEARADSVEDLVAMALRGELRIPVFQRGLKWQAKHVLELFDSMWCGYPIGSLLLRRGPGPAGPFHLGPLALFGQESARALWVIDGQQRLTSMAAALARPEPQPTTPTDPYVVYFDAKARIFAAPPRDGRVPSHWVPLPRLLDGAALSEWVFSWDHGKDAELRAAVFEAGRRLREYRVPSYIIDTDDEDTLRNIFHRVNSAGVRLEWSEVHDALFGHKNPKPSSLHELADALAALGMGRPDEDEQLLRCVVAMCGLDVTRSFGEHVQQHRDELSGAMAQAAPVLREALGFLRERASIPHLRLLPRSTPLPVLARFFALHPEPCERSLTLLVRWLWRSILAPLGDERTLIRHGVAAINNDEEGSVQRLLGLVGKTYHFEEQVLFLDKKFDARTSHSRLCMAALASLEPHTLALLLPQQVDVASLLEAAGREAFRPIVEAQGAGAANRVLLPGKGYALAELISFIDAAGPEHPVLRSHLIDRACAEALVANDLEGALALRTEAIELRVLKFGASLAEWNANDRPSIEYLLAQAETA